MLSTTSVLSTGIYLGVFSLPWCIFSTTSALTLARFLYNFSAEYRYVPWRSLYNFSAEHRYVPWHVLSTTSALRTGTYLGAFSLQLQCWAQVCTLSCTLYNVSAEHRYIPGRVLSTASVLITVTFFGVLSTTSVLSTGMYLGVLSTISVLNTGTCLGTFFLQLQRSEQVHTLVRSLYNFSNEHRYVPWRVLSQ